MHTIRHVLRQHQIVRVPGDMSVYETAELMALGGIGAIPVVARDRLIGIFSERDLMTRVVVPGRDAHRVPVSEVMTRDVVTAQLNESREVAIRKMKRAGCRHLPIMAGGRLVGMLSMRDLLRDALEEQDEEIRHLREYLYQQPPA